MRVCVCVSIVDILLYVGSHQQMSLVQCKTKNHKEDGEKNKIKMLKRTAAEGIFVSRNSVQVLTICLHSFERNGWVGKNGSDYFLFSLSKSKQVMRDVLMHGIDMGTLF